MHVPYPSGCSRCGLYCGLDSVFNADRSRNIGVGSSNECWRNICINLRCNCESVSLLGQPLRKTKLHAVHGLDILFTFLHVQWDLGSFLQFSVILGVLLKQISCSSLDEDQVTRMSILHGADVARLVTAASQSLTRPPINFKIGVKRHTDIFANRIALSAPRTFLACCIAFVL
eukprot:2073707-Amphidinium_carterae.1